LSRKDEDLDKTDLAAMECIDKERRFQDFDNYNWIKDAKKNKLVVGTKARILYQDAYGRLKIALKFNEMVRNNEVGPIMLGRDHHDTGGTDSPFRETSNIKDGSNIMADMATHVALGNSARGMSLVTLHNGGGVGIGKVINGGYGMVLDGSRKADEILKTAMLFDVMAGVSRRAWARQENSISTVEEYNSLDNNSYITLPNLTNSEFISALVNEKYIKGGK
jgi:urocanate hydratase